MSVDLRDYILEWAGEEVLRVIAYVGSADDLGGRKAVQVTFLESGRDTTLGQIEVERLRTRLSMYLNADDHEDQGRPVPYTSHRGERPFRAAFFPPDKVTIWIGGRAHDLTDAQAEDLHEVLSERLAGDLDEFRDGRPARVFPDGTFELQDGDDA